MDGDDAERQAKLDAARKKLRKFQSSRTRRSTSNICNSSSSLVSDSDAAILEERPQEQNDPRPQIAQSLDPKILSISTSTSFVAIKDNPDTVKENPSIKESNHKRQDSMELLHESIQSVDSLGAQITSTLANIISSSQRKLSLTSPPVSSSSSIPISPSPILPNPSSPTIPMTPEPILQFATTKTTSKSPTIESTKEPLQHKIDILMRDNQAQLSIIEQLKRDNEAQRLLIDTFQSEKRQFIDSVHEKSNTILSLEKKIDSLMMNIETLSNAKDDEISKFERLVESINAELEDKNNIIVSLEEKVTDSVNETNAVKSQLKMAQERVEDILAGETECRKSLETSLKTIGEKEQEILKVSSNLQKSETELVVLKTRLEAFKETEQELESCRQEIMLLRDEKVGLTDEISSLKVAIGKMTVGIEKERMSLAGKLNLADGAINDHDRLIFRVEELEGLVQALNTERDHLAKSLHAKDENMADSMKVERDQLRTQRDTLASEKNRIESELQRIVTDRDKFKAEAQALKTRLEALETRVGEEIVRAAKASKDSESMHQELSREIDVYKKKQFELESAMKVREEQFEKDVSMYKQQLSETKEEKERLKAEKNEAALKIETLEMELEQRLTPKIPDVNDDEHQQQITALKEKLLDTANEKEQLKNQISKLESEMLRIRLAQSDIGAILLKGRDAVSTDLVQTLQHKCEQLADSLLSSQSETAALQHTIELYKSRLNENLIAKNRVVELEAELAHITSRFNRESETWQLKEKTIAAERQRISIDYHTVMMENNAIKRDIMAHPLSNDGRIGFSGVSSGRLSELDLREWVRWMMESYTKLVTELEETHRILDLQHEKLESAMSRASFSVDGDRDGDEVSMMNVSMGGASSARSNHKMKRRIPQGGLYREIVREWSAKLQDPHPHPHQHQHGMFSPMARASSLPIFNGAYAMSARGDEDRTDYPESEVDSVLMVPLDPIQQEPTSLNGVPPSPSLLHQPIENEDTTHHDPEGLKLAYASLATRYSQLEQKSTSIASQLDQQIKANEEIKKLIVDVAVGRSTSSQSLKSLPSGDDISNSSNMMDLYNAALVEINTLRADVEQWRSEHSKLTQALEEAHQTLDLQQEKMESLLSK